MGQSQRLDVRLSPPDRCLPCRLQPPGLVLHRLRDRWNRMSYLTMRRSIYRLSGVFLGLLGIDLLHPAFAAELLLPYGLLRSEVGRNLASYHVCESNLHVTCVKVICMHEDCSTRRLLGRSTTDCLIEFLFLPSIDNPLIMPSCLLLPLTTWFLQASTSLAIA